MDPSVLIAITQGVNLVAAFGPIGIQLALQIKKLFQGADSGAGFDVQIQAFKGGILQDAAATDVIVDEWLAKHPA